MLRRFSRDVFRYMLALCLVLPATPLVARQKAASLPKSLTITSVNEEQWQAKRKPSTSFLIRVQVLLDRAHSPPGVIDGQFGENTRKAIEAFSEISGLEPTDNLDERLWSMLIGKDSDPALSPTKLPKKTRPDPS
jgi:hypothetical protein